MAYSNTEVPKTIVLSYVNDALYREGKAASTVTPGDFVNKTSSNTIQRNTAAGLSGPLSIAVADRLQGRTIADDYATDDLVTYIYPARGTYVYAFLPAAAAAVVVGDALELSNDGTLVKRTTGAVVATALEAVDNSAGGSKARIQVEIV